MAFVFIVALAAAVIWLCVRLRYLRRELADLQDALELIRLESRGPRKLTAADAAAGLVPKIRAVDSLITAATAPPGKEPDVNQVVVSLGMNQPRASAASQSESHPSTASPATSAREAHSAPQPTTGSDSREWALLGVFLCFYASAFVAARIAGNLNTLSAVGVVAGLSISALAVSSWLNARRLALLGVAGGFLALPLLSLGSNQHGLIFAFMLLLSLTSVVVAWQRRWNFLVPVSVIGTVLAQAAWLVSWFSPARLEEVVAASLTWNALYLGAFFLFARRRREDQGVVLSALGLPFVSLALGWFLISHPTVRVPIEAILALTLGASACVLAVVWARPDLRHMQTATSAGGYVLLGFWAALHLDRTNAGAALVCGAVFVLAQFASPFVLRWRSFRPRASAGRLLRPDLSIPARPAGAATASVHSKVRIS